LEFWFNKPFSNVRPDFIKFISGNNLELDLYNEELNLAVEYNGRQHYIFPNKFMETKEQFELLLFKDHFKIQKCIENKINLIVVPYYVKEEDIPEFLWSRLPDHLKSFACGNM